MAADKMNSMRNDGKGFYTIWLSALAIRIAEKGLSAAELAEQLCLSESAFYKRKSGRMEFGA